MVLGFKLGGLVFPMQVLHHLSHHTSQSYLISNMIYWEHNEKKKFPLLSDQCPSGKSSSCSEVFRNKGKCNKWADRSCKYVCWCFPSEGQIFPKQDSAPFEVLRVQIWLEDQWLTSSWFLLWGRDSCSASIIQHRIQTST